MRDAILAELGLMPLWLPRAEQPQAVAQSVVIVLQRNDGKMGWFVTNTPLTGEAAILFTNVCDGLGLQQLTESQVIDNNFMQLPEEVDWMWLSGVSHDNCNIVADLPVFESVSMIALVDNAQCKARLWADWCDWRFS